MVVGVVVDVVVVVEGTPYKYCIAILSHGVSEF